MVAAFDALAATVETACLDSDVVRSAPLGPRTTYRVGGAAEILVVVAHLTDLEALATVAAAADVETLAIGRGSNLLVADAGFAGIAVTLGPAFDTESIDGTTVTAGGARALPLVARATVAAGLSGFEWAVGVPGSIGGAVRMNAGGHGSDMAESLVSARIVDLVAGSSTVVAVADLDLAYRRSAVRRHQVVAEATLKFDSGDAAASSRLLAEIVRWRRDNQPGGANAGSVFTNPEGDSAGRLIEAAGCKRLRVGSAEVSTKHANFIQADTDGSANDVRELMGEVQRRVVDKFGIELVPETHLIGFEEHQ